MQEAWKDTSPAVGVGVGVGELFGNYLVPPFRA
jgi:hypothetical protein